MYINYVILYIYVNYGICNEIFIEIKDKNIIYLDKLRNIIYLVIYINYGICR